MKSQTELNSSLDATGYVFDAPLRLGAKNLIKGCLGDVFGKTILIVAEDPQLGWYDAAAPASVEAVLMEMGATGQNANGWRAQKPCYRRCSNRHKFG